MRSKVDLHLHSTASDGKFSPAELVKMALERGLEVISITDHDTTDGIEEALEAAKGTNLEVIPGVEISADIPRKEVHLLGYYIDHRDGTFEEVLRLIRRYRVKRALAMLEKLASLGIRLKWDMVMEIAGRGSVGRPHIAQAMVKEGYVSSMEEAFLLYIGRDGPAYVERYKLAPSEAVRLIKGAKGLAVLAHPSKVIELLPSLVKAGLVGIEARYNDYPEEEVEYLAGLARKYNLVPTGGSDFHGHERSGIGSVWVPMEWVKRLRDLATSSPHLQAPL
jgi:hypothetical protein